VGVGGGVCLVRPWHCQSHVVVGVGGAVCLVRPWHGQSHIVVGVVVCA